MVGKSRGGQGLIGWSEIEKKVVEAAREGWGFISGGQGGEGRGGRGGQRQWRKNREGKGKKERDGTSKIIDYQKYPKTSNYL